MVRGFYALGAGMLTKERQMAVITNNIANVQTPGFKKDTMTSKTFGNLVINRMDTQANPLGDVSIIPTPDTTVTNFEAGSMRQTGRNLDFAIQDDGFFAVQGENGLVYTRNGSFNVDDEGYLSLSHVGRVLGADGQPILLGTDNVTADSTGNLFINEAPAGRLGVYRFADNQTLLTTGEGMYTGNGAQPADNATLQWKYVEDSNVNVGREMTDALEAQRALQNCSQTLKMYDQILASATTEIGKV